MRDTTEIAFANFGAEINFPRIGGTTSSRSIQATGSATGIAAAITSGEDIIADSSTGPGSCSTSDFIHGGRIGPTRTIITLTITIRIRTATTRVITIPALTKATSITARTATEMPTPTQPLLPRSSDWREKVIIADKSTACLARRRGPQSRNSKPTTVYV